MSQVDPPGGRLSRVPVGLFLVPAHALRPRQSGRELPDWYGVHPDHVAQLIARYTRDDDVVLDLDAHPTIAAAARYLHRRPVAPLGERCDGAARVRGCTAVEDGAGLVIATLPRMDYDSADVAELGHVVGSWRTLLRPGGHILILIIAGPGVSGAGHRSTFVAAARAAGLIFHQHIPVALVPLAEAGGCAEHGVVPRPGLVGGRHVRAHRDLLVFASITAEAADA